MLNRATFAATAQEKVKTVQYKDLDCQAFVEYCAKKAGYTFNARGSNDIYRNYLAAKGLTASFPIAIGDVVFKHRVESSKLPSRYHGDGIGDMYHIGIVTAVAPYQVCHSANSKDNGKVDNFSSLDALAQTWQYSGTLKETETDVLSLLRQAIKILENS